MNPEARLSPGQRALVRFLERQGVAVAPPSVPEPEERIHDRALFGSLERVISQARLAELLSSRLHLPFVDLNVRELDADTVALLEPRLALRYEVIPLGERQGMLEIAMANPLDIETVKTVEFASSRRVRPSVATYEGVWRALVRHYGAPEPETPAAATARHEPACGETSPSPGTLPDAEEPAPTAAGRQRSPRILVVDPDLARRTGARSVLEGAGLGCLVITARDAGEAAAIATLDPPDVVVIDAGWEADGGRDLWRRLRANARTERVRIVQMVHPGAERRSDDAEERGGLPGESWPTAELAVRVRSLVATADVR